jgi:hypothetical protein
MEAVFKKRDQAIPPSAAVFPPKCLISRLDSAAPVLIFGSAALLTWICPATGR